MLIILNYKRTGISGHQIVYRDGICDESQIMKICLEQKHLTLSLDRTPFVYCEYIYSYIVKQNKM